jgi:hypothetical protein
VRAAAFFAGGVVFAAAAVVAVLLFSRTRSMILSKAVARADASLPGDLSIGKASWPSIGSLDFSDVSWTDGTDSLVVADRIFVSVDLMSLFEKDIRVEDAVLDGVTADIPAIRARFAKPDTARKEEKKNGRGFPRGGSFPGIPSLCAERLRVGAAKIRLSGTSEIRRVAAALGFDATSGASPWVRVDTLTVAGPPGSWRVDRLSMYVAPDRGVIRGNGAGAFSPDWPLRFSVTPLGKDRFTLAVATGGADSALSAPIAGGDTLATAAAPADSALGAVGAWFDVTLARDGLRVRSVAVVGRLRTPGTAELAKTRLFGPRVEGFPDLDGLGIAVRATAALGDERSFEAECSLEKNNWIDGGEIAASYGDDGLFLRNVSLGFPDLSIVGRGAMDADSLRASADIHVTGARWIETLFPGTGHPDPLSAALRVNAARERGRGVVRAHVAAKGTVGTFTVDALDIGADLSLDGAEESRVVLAAEAGGYSIGVGADIVREPDVLVRLLPVILQTTPVDPSRIVFSEGAKGEIRYSQKAGSAIAKGVRITGDAGDLAIDAELDSARRGPFSIEYRASAPPPVLVKALGLTEEKARRLRSDWAADAPFSLEIGGELISAKGPRIAASGVFVLPGPRNLAALLPDSARVADLSPFRGELAFSTGSGPAGMSFEARVDFDSTEWIRSSLVRAHGGSGEVVIDTLGIAVEGMSAGGSGKIDRGVYDVTAHLSIQNTEFVRRFVRGVPDAVLHGAAEFKGTPEKPALRAKADGSLKGSGFVVPMLAVEVDLDTTGGRAAIRMPNGIVTPQLRMKRALVTAASTGASGGFFPIRVSLDAAGEKLSVRQSLRADTTGGVTIDVDTLVVVFGEQDLRARKSLRVRPLAGGGLAVENVDLSGSLGKIQIEGVVAPDSSNITGTISILLPETPPPAIKRPHLWPEEIALGFRASGAHDAAAKLRVTGFELVDNRRPDLELEVKTGEKGIETEIAVADSAGDVVRCRGTVPAEVRVYPPSAALRDGPVSFGAVMARVPVAARWVAPESEIQQDKIFYLNGRVEAGGTAASPVGAAKFTIDFAGWPKLSEYSVALDAVMGSRAGVDSALAADRLGVSADLAKKMPERFRSGLAAVLRLERAGRTVLSARAASPLEASLHPPRMHVVEDGIVEVQVESEEIQLGDFDPLLPMDIGLGGTVKIALAADGPVRDFSLDGRVVTRDFNVAAAGKAEVVAVSELRLSGSSARPVIKGDIKITGGLIRVPDMPKNLHAREGKAYLWRDSLAAAVLDTVPAPAAASVETKQDGKGRFAGEFDVSIRIPSAFWIRGKGLDIELGGDLNVREKNGRPFITGELRALRGDLIVLGRTLDLERGTVTFYGGDETNPSLDISLTTNVEGTKIEILLSGTAQKPRIDMRSEPDLSQTDIMSVLLFGQSSGDLDDEQTDLVKSRSTEMLASLGAAKVQEEIGGELGVDVVTVKSAGANNEGSAVSLGKYLNPRTLLSYAYPLDTQSQPSVSLEYFLKGRFVVRSTYDIHDGLGSLGVGWSKDY